LVEAETIEHVGRAGERAGTNARVQEAIDLGPIS
jgi:hypothetical protein